MLSSMVCYVANYFGEGEQDLRMILTECESMGIRIVVRERDSNARTNSTLIKE